MYHVCASGCFQREECHSWKDSFHLRHQSSSPEAEDAHACWGWLGCAGEAKVFSFRKSCKSYGGFLEGIG